MVTTKTCYSAQVEDRIQNPGIVSNLIHDHHLIKGARFLTLEKLSSKELYSILITKFTNKPSSNVYFEKIFPNMKLDWRKIYILPRITTVNTYLRSFQYKILNNILFLNKKLFVFRKKNTPLCSFCNKEEETLLHIFSECTYVIYLWQQLATFFGKQFDFASTYNTDCLAWALE